MILINFKKMQSCRLQLKKPTKNVVKKKLKITTKTHQTWLKQIVVVSCLFHFQFFFWFDWW